MKKILISGCSFTDGTAWPAAAFESDRFQIKNMAASGFGNNYISNSITANLDYDPDFVFVLWSGINRIELRVPDVSIMKTNLTNFANCRQIEHSLFYRSGGILQQPTQSWLEGYHSIKAPDWPDIHSFEDWFDLPVEIKKECLEHKLGLSLHQHQTRSTFVNNYFMNQYIEYDPKYLSELTFQHMVNCFNFLERLNIPYRFAFIYDIFAHGTHYSHGEMIKEKYYNYIDWNKYIDLPAWEYAIRHDLLSEDQYHPTPEGHRQWGQEIRRILGKDTELKTLFQ